MSRATRIGLSAAVGLGGLVAAGWLGLQIEPGAFAPSAQGAFAPDTVELPRGLPAPVLRYFRAAIGDRVPIITSAVLTGRGWLRLFGVTFPARFRFTHVAGQGYRHEIECTWFGQPLLKVNESYLDGRARMELPVGTIENEPNVDMAANLALWGEAIWLPSVLVTDPRVRWEAIDSFTARLVVPFRETEDSFTVVFDEATGLVRSMEALRYRGARDEAKIPWRFEPLGWQTFHDLRIPSPGAVTWMDEGSPWLVITIESVAYNVDFSPDLRAPGS